jgi:hypothetical protein
VPGRELAHGLREVAFQSQRRMAGQLADVTEALKGLSHREIIETMKMGGGRRHPGSNQKLAKVNARLLQIADRDMTEASDLGFTRMVNGKRIALKGRGEWFPQVPNAEGVAFLDAAHEEGMGNAEVKTWAEGEVTAGRATDADAALARLLDYRDRRLRNTHPYFESSRTWLPEEFVEWDPDKVLPGLFHRNALMIEGVRHWGLEADPANPGVPEFTRAKALIERIGREHGAGEREVVKQFLQTEFGSAPPVPTFLNSVVNIANGYQTYTKLGFSPLSAAHNLAQGNANMFSAPLSAQAKGMKTWVGRLWSHQARRMLEQVHRSGAVQSGKELGAIERGPSNEPRAPGAAMAMFGATETSNHVRAALIARYAAEKHLADLLKLQQNGPLARVVYAITHANLSPQRYLRWRLQNMTFTNRLTDAEFDALMQRGTLTLSDVDRIMHRATTDTQFAQNLASKPLWWRTSPMLRLLFKFKTFGVNQARLAVQDVGGSAMRGNFAPLFKFLLFMALSGEIWNLARDGVSGGDHSFTSKMINRPEKRTPAGIATALREDFMAGGGLGILTDMMYGFSNFVLGPTKATLGNLWNLAKNLDDPRTAAREFVRKEVSAVRQVDGGLDRIDRMFFNENNRTSEYKRWRDRTFEWRDRNVGQLDQFKRNLEGPPDYDPDLQLQAAARQITVGDIDDAADYLAAEIRTATNAAERERVFERIQRSRDAYAPLGKVKLVDRLKFMRQFTPEERKEATRLAHLNPALALHLLVLPDLSCPIGERPATSPNFPY